MTEKKKINLAQMNKAEAKKFLEEQNAKALKLRFDISSKQIKNHREYRNAKKNIAKALTFLSQN